MVRRIQEEGDVRQTAVAVVIWAAAAIFFLGAAYWLASLPVVDRSTSTGECVGVGYPESRYTCQTVPDWPTLTRWVP